MKRLYQNVVAADVSPREFNVPAEWSGKRVLLHFGAVDWEATVYMNGRSVGTHRGGHDAFSFDLTPFIKRDGGNELIVGVFDPGNDAGIAVGKQENSRFSNPQRYSYCPSSGIWQTVWLEPVAERAITDLHTVRDIDRGTLTVTVNTDSLGTNSFLQITALDGGDVVASGRGNANQPIVLSIPQAKLWSPKSPHLYDLRVALRQGDATLDEVKSYFGMRKITDVENEMNGWFTYDRKVDKLDRERVAKANRALWEGDVNELNVVHPTDGGALNTPDEGATRKKRQ